MSGQNIEDTLSPGFTPKMILWLFFTGGLTVFNKLPGIITGFGKEFGRRGLMFPLLYRTKPWVGLVVGGLLWYGWHMPLSLVTPVSTNFSIIQQIKNHLIRANGALCTFTFLAYVYVRSRSIFVTSIAHISMNNAAVSFSYFVTIQNQLMANLGLMLTMLFVIAVLDFRNELDVLDLFPQSRAGWVICVAKSESTTSLCGPG